MKPILITCNVNSADVMPHAVAHAVNPNDMCVVHATHMHWHIRHTYVFIMCQQSLIGLACKFAN